MGSGCMLNSAPFYVSCHLKSAQGSWSGVTALLCREQKYSIIGSPKRGSCVFILLKEKHSLHVQNKRVTRTLRSFSVQSISLSIFALLSILSVEPIALGLGGVSSFQPIAVCVFVVNCHGVVFFFACLPQVRDWTSKAALGKCPGHTCNRRGFSAEKQAGQGGILLIFL